MLRGFYACMFNKFLDVYALVLSVVKKSRAHGSRNCPNHIIKCYLKRLA
uniref:Uncharacterized protein n=1 Tax=Anguilla anguilla TaxID=7936 RepID=A0A0E9QXD0_ANGAN